MPPAGAGMPVPTVSESMAVSRTKSLSLSNPAGPMSGMWLPFAGFTTYGFTVLTYGMLVTSGTLKIASFAFGSRVCRSASV